MNINLKNKLLSWNEEILSNFYKYLPIFSIPDLKGTPIWESDDLGFYTITPIAIWYYRSDGVIETITTNTNDYPILTDLYNKSVGTTVRFSKPSEQSIDGDYEYIMYVSPAGSLGNPASVDYINLTIDTNFIRTFIDDTAWIINTLKSANSLFPASLVGFHNRFKDTEGYYFNGLTRFNLTYEDFITGQLDKFEESLNRTSLFLNNNGLNVTELLTYAESKWKI